MLPAHQPRAGHLKSTHYTYPSSYDYKSHQDLRTKQCLDLINKTKLQVEVYMVSENSACIPDRNNLICTSNSLNDLALKIAESKKRFIDRRKTEITANLPNQILAPKKSGQLGNPAKPQQLQNLRSVKENKFLVKQTEYFKNSAPEIVKEKKLLVRHAEYFKNFSSEIRTSFQKPDPECDCTPNKTNSLNSVNSVSLQKSSLQRASEKIFLQSKDSLEQTPNLTNGDLTAKKDSDFGHEVLGEESMGLVTTKLFSKTEENEGNTPEKLPAPACDDDYRYSRSSAVRNL
jgi:hypothetical protein